jgi:hypothetical protein
MARGLAVSRSLVFVLETGEAVFDWGDGRVQDIMSGDFLSFSEGDHSRPITDAELQALKNNGRVEAYDNRTIYLRPLPDVPRQTID